jgi:archaellum component FlaG (FlaF/FlaG flagellin family)
VPRTNHLARRPLVAVLALAIALSAGLAAADPRLGIEEPVSDFGTVEQGTPVTHVFQLKNTGDTALRISNVKSSCGCTAAVVSDHDVQPGGEARVLATLDTSRVAGRTTKVLSVYSDDPQVPVAALTLTGTVLADLTLTPNPVYLGRIRRGEAVTREVVIRPGRPLGKDTVRAVTGELSGLQTRLDLAADGTQRLVLGLGPDVPLGRFTREVRLETTSARQPVIVLPVFGSIEGDVVVLPSQVSFGVARAGASPERRLLIRNRGLQPLTVRRVSVPDAFDYSLRTLENGLEYQLSLKLRDDVRPGTVSGEVEIFTDHPTEQRVVVPLHAVVQRRG